MLRFLRTRQALIDIIVALIIAYISAKFLFHGAVANIIPWGILAFASAFLASNQKEAWKLGGLFGFVVSYSFLWFDNTGIKHVNQIIILIPLVILPSLFGAFCGSSAAWLGWLLRQMLRKR